MKNLSADCYFSHFPLFWHKPTILMPARHTHQHTVFYLTGWSVAYWQNTLPVCLKLCFFYKGETWLDCASGQVKHCYNLMTVIRLIMAETIKHTMPGARLWNTTTEKKLSLLKINAGDKNFKHGSILRYKLSKRKRKKRKEKEGKNAMNFWSGFWSLYK